ncbi:MAG: two-component regulator propeller domain-containing protein [Bacteroidales bacterium]
MKRYKNRFYSQGYTLLLFLLCHLPYSLFAQSVDLNFRYLSTKDGLSYDNVLCIYQDRDGFMWFGTENGISRYDGNSFRNYYDLIKDTSSIFQQRTLAVCEDSYNGLWFCNDTNGLVLLNKQNEKTYRFRHSTGKPESISSNNTRVLFEDSRKQLWIATRGGGLDLFNRKDSSFIHFVHDSLDAKSIGSNFITSITEDSEGTLWMASADGLLIRYDQKDKVFENVMMESGLMYLFDDVNMPVAYVDSKDVVWYAGVSGVFRFNKSDKSSRFYSLFPQGGVYTTVWISSVIELDESKLLLASFNRGLFELNTETGRVVNYTYNPASPFGINSNRLTVMLRSAEGAVWIGTSDNGLNIYTPKTFRFSSLVNLVQPQFLDYSTYQAFSVCETPDGRIWIGASDNGVIEFNPREGSLKPILPELNGRSVFDLYKDRHNRIWIGAMGEGINYYDWDKKKLIHMNRFDDRDKSLIGRDVGRILEDSRGRLWVSYLRDGVALFDRTSMRVMRFRNNPADMHTLSNNLVYKIYEDSRGRIWIGTADGLCLFNPRNNSFLRIPFRDESDQDNYSITIYDILEDSRKRLWIGTDDNLYLFDANLTACVGFKGNKPNEPFVISRIFQDKNNMLWLSTTSGVCSYDPETKVIKDYGKTDGIHYLNYNPTSGTLSRSGLIYFGSSKGLTVFNPLSIQDDPYVPPVFITGLSINHIPVKPGVEDAFINCSIEYLKQIRLNHKQSTLFFNFAALNFNNPGNNQYSYILENFDKAWSKPSTTSTALYPNLPPGRYVFRVTASNSHGIWNTEGATLEVIIKPPFWRTWWFLLVDILTVVLLLIYILYNRFYRLQKQKALLEVVVNERTKELNSVNLALKEQHEELIQQHEEISTQNEMLSQMSDEILKQNAELEQHRSNLEKLVEERTRELEIAIEKAEESDKLKSAFLANMSHEIRTPMNAIVGFSNMLKDEHLELQERNEFINVINTNSEVLLVLIDDILDLSLIEADQLNIKKEIFGLNEVLDHLYSSFSLMNRKPELAIRLNNELHNQDLKINSDLIRIKQILSNLLNNAYKFTDKGFVELGLKEILDELVFYVKDTGIGIKEPDVEKVFERFRKSEAAANALYRGTGLGLAISRALAKLLGGSLSVESVFGEGSVFYLKLPLSLVTVEEIKALKTTAHKDIHKWTDKHVLVVEDEQANYLYVEKVLGKMEVIVHWAPNGQEAVDLVASGEQFDVILMDIKMPVMDGFEATKIIKERNPEQVVIALTAYARPEDRTHFMSAGFEDYLSKPIRPNDFLGVIRRYI